MAIIIIQENYTFIYSTTIKMVILVYGEGKFSYSHQYIIHNT